MPTAATMGGTAGGTGASTGPNKQAAPVSLVPFVRASQIHHELFHDNTKVLTTSDQDQGSIDVNAYGYIRGITIEVAVTGGAGAAVFAEDGPWSVLKNIIVSEPNGATIAQFNSGYELYLANKWGGYFGANDPSLSPTYSANVTGGIFTFSLYIPIEINERDGLGSLPNQNSAASFKFRYTIASAATSASSEALYSTQPATTLGTARVRAYLEAWDQPELSAAGSQNQVTPPAMNTTQFWSVQRYAVNSGAFNVRLTRVGNYLRNVIFVLRRTSGTRANGDADWPDPATLYLDTRPVEYIDRNQWLGRAYRRFGYAGNFGGTKAAPTALAAEAPGGRDNGVFVWDFTHEFDGIAGHENRDLWQPTLNSTRLELQGSFANAGTLTVLTNDVSVAGNVFL